MVQRTLSSEVAKKGTTNLAPDEIPRMTHWSPLRTWGAIVAVWPFGLPLNHHFQSTSQHTGRISGMNPLKHVGGDHFKNLEVS